MEEKPSPHNREATLKQIHAIIEYLEDDKLIIVYRNIQRILLHGA